MDTDTQKMFQRVAEKLGWAEQGGLDRAEEELRKTVTKSRRPALGSFNSKPLSGKVSPLMVQLSDNDSSGKENSAQRGQGYRNHALLDSSEDDFDLFLAEKMTPKPPSKVSNSAACKTREPVTVLTSDSDDSFENFLNRVKTPKAPPRGKSVGESDESLKHFIVDSLSSDDDFVFEKKPRRPKNHLKTPQSVPAAQREATRPLSRCNSPVFLSDSDDSSDIVIKSTWRTRHARPGPRPPATQGSMQRIKGRGERSASLPAPPSPAPSPSAGPVRHQKPVGEDSVSSEDEFHSLLDRIKRNQKLGSSSRQASPKPPPVRAVSVDAPRKPVCLSEPSTRTKQERPVDRTPTQKPRAQPVSQTEPRPTHTSRVGVCKTPGCFLQALSVPDSTHYRTFKQNKEQLTSKLYLLYNTSVFQDQLPADMSVTWNKKLRKTAGYCITGQERSTARRYARIELSVKVCDSPDRLRDTLVHEMCHAATWLINGVRDGHGPFWKIYARKATLAHPELPMVTRCHSYDINYKYQYQCTRCKNTIGRHSKSLDTQRFVCALCTGKLVLLAPATPRAATPFANFVKENYGSVRQELVGQRHADVMRKLSADFASKTRLSQS